MTTARDYLDSIIATCAKLQSEPTYLGFIKSELQRVDGVLDTLWESIEARKDEEQGNGES